MTQIIKIARAHNCDGVLGVGGGSALDMAKIVSITLVADRPADDYWMMATPLPPKAYHPLWCQQPQVQAQKAVQQILFLIVMVTRAGFGGLKRSQI